MQPSGGAWEFTESPAVEPNQESEELSYPPVRTRRRHRYVMPALVAVAAVAVGSWWFLVRTTSTPVKITYAGAAVSDPQGTLATAETSFATLVDSRHGRTKTSSRCYFERPTTQRANGRSSDVTNTVLCGPVLFFDGDVTRPYLTYRLAASASAGPVSFTVSNQPTHSDPAAAPAATTLVRPDGTSAPVATAGMSVPIPPSAAADVLQAVDVVRPAHLTSASFGAVIGANTIKIRLDDYGPVRDYGEGASERSAPPREELIAFQLEFDGGENSLAPLSAVDLGVSVVNGPTRPLKLSQSGTAE
ncbi:MAG: hypothetical protein QOJ37_1511, partial [Pseudonocardiales bacterium]|nr:hypothetical protein [Pseudonocardiales bacterium]